MSSFSLGILIAIGTENFFNKLMAKLIEFLYSLSDSYLFHSFIHSSTKYLHIMHCSKHRDVAKNKTNQNYIYIYIYIYIYTHTHTHINKLCMKVL